MDTLDGAALHRRRASTHKSDTIQSSRERNGYVILAFGALSE